MNSKSFILVSILVFGFLPILSHATTTPFVYTPLVGIPSLVATDFGSYINALYGLSIAVAALMAVIKIIIAGVKYMISDIVTTKSEAIGDIRGSLLGLGVVISAVLVLTIINPQLTKTEIFMDKLDATPAKATTTVAIPATQNGRYAGYTFRKIHPDPGFKNACVPPAIYEVKTSGGETFEVCYAGLPIQLTNELRGIFNSASTDFDTIVYRFQTAHRPRMITDSRLDQIAFDENTLTRSKDDVLLAVEYVDGRANNPPFSIDWIDHANSGSIRNTCLRYQQALATTTASITTNVQLVGHIGKGYLACVLMR